MIFKVIVNMPNGKNYVEEFCKAACILDFHWNPYHTWGAHKGRAENKELVITEISEDKSEIWTDYWTYKRT